jgi:hypothetical protein
VPDNPNPPTPREWAVIGILTLLTSWAYIACPIFKAG